MHIDTEAAYAKLTWAPSVAGYPAGLTLGNLVGLSAEVAFTGVGQPYYMLAFTDLTGGLGQTNKTDQILMIEFHNTNLSGNSMAFDPNTTQVNLYDNDRGFYLAGGQQVTNTLAGWLSLKPFLAGESLDEVRIGIGNAPGGTNPESLTVNSLAITTPTVPEPTSFLLFLTVLGATGLGTYRRYRRGRRS